MQVLRWGLRFCISYRLPVDVEAAEFPSTRPFFPFSLPSLFLGVSDTCSHLVDASIHHWDLLVSCGYLCSQNDLFKMKVWSCHLNFLKLFSVPRLHSHNMIWPTCLCSFFLHYLCISSCRAPFLLPLMLMCLLSQGFGSCGSLYVTLSLPSHKYSFTSQLPSDFLPLPGLSCMKLRSAAGRQGFGGTLLDVGLESVSSSGALCTILGSCRLHKRCLSKATLPGRVVMAKVHFMVSRRKRKNKEFPLETESCHLKLASGAAVCLCVHSR